eukprot:scaffold12366_cov68-Cyclotella_meneghiniana.AAC.8
MGLHESSQGVRLSIAGTVHSSSLWSMFHLRLTADTQSAVSRHRHQTSQIKKPPARTSRMTGFAPAGGPH